SPAVAPCRSRFPARAGPPPVRARVAADRSCPRPRRWCVLRSAPVSENARLGPIGHPHRVCRTLGVPPSAPRLYESPCALSRAAREPLAARVLQQPRFVSRSTRRSALRPANRSQDKIAFRFSQTRVEGNGKL